MASAVLRSAARAACRVSAARHAWHTVRAVQPPHLCPGRCMSGHRTATSQNRKGLAWLILGSVGMGVGGFHLWKDHYTHKIDNDAGLPGVVANLIASSRKAQKAGDIAAASKLMDSALHYAVQAGVEKSKLAMLHRHVGELQMAAGDDASAIPHLTEVLREVLIRNKGQPDATAVDLSLKMAHAKQRLRKYRDAEAGFRWCVEQAEYLVDANPKDTNALSLLGMAYEQRGIFLAGQCKFEEAAGLLIKASNLARDHPSNLNAVAARCALSASRCLRKIDDQLEAATWLRDAMVLSEASSEMLEFTYEEMRELGCTQLKPSTSQGRMNTLQVPSIR
eukprot:m.359804 g.359804  ORF g.359804 m.359804 type:complete len:335 (-) comp18745_c0_seq1:349-1353(-)